MTCRHCIAVDITVLEQRAQVLREQVRRKVDDAVDCMESGVRMTRSQLEEIGRVVSMYGLVQRQLGDAKAKLSPLRGWELP